MSHTTGKSPVLIVEDNDDTRDTMQLLLELEGFKVLTARNGQEALQTLRQHDRVCLVLLDWMMPVMNGGEFLEAIESDPELTRIPVVVMTAFSPEEHGIPSNHLRKPLSRNELVREVSSHCATAT